MDRTRVACHGRGRNLLRGCIDYRRDEADRDLASGGVPLQNGPFDPDSASPAKVYRRQVTTPHRLGQRSGLVPEQGGGYFNREEPSTGAGHYGRLSNRRIGRGDHSRIMGCTEPAGHRLTVSSASK